MRMLIVEDDFVTRSLLQKIVAPFGDCEIAVDGEEAVAAFKLAIEEGQGYDLIFMDIMMPNLDGRGALKQIREFEAEQKIEGLSGVKVMMTSTLNDAKNIVGSFFNERCEAYVTKPYSKEKIISEMRKLDLLK